MIKKLSRLQLKNLHGSSSKEYQSAYDETPKDCYLNWIYWDEDGKIAKFYNINTYPTHFLLDARGTIIKKNITLEELDQFLLKNLK
jgi:hypothetical protein